MPDRGAGAAIQEAVLSTVLLGGPLWSALRQPFPRKAALTATSIGMMGVAQGLTAALGGRGRSRDALCHLSLLAILVLAPALQLPTPRTAMRR